MDPSLPPFACRFTPALADLLAGLNCSLLLSTYQAGKVVILSSDGETIRQLPRNFNSPMGVAVDGDRMAVATKHEIVYLVNDARLTPGYPGHAGRYDALFVPRVTHHCGELSVHDMAWTREGLVGVNTLFSCLFRLDDRFSFVPLWKPGFITRLAPEDRCHLNGLALEAGEPKYVTALGATDSHEGWRPNKLTDGVLIDIPSGGIVLDGLPMPHSPRVIDGALFALLAATGELIRVDPASGKFDIVARVPGYARGLAWHGDYLFIGHSTLRRTHTFGDLALARPGVARCGVTVIHRATGAVVGEFEYLNSVEEIYDVHVLPGMRRPGILGPESDLHARAVCEPAATWWGEPASGDGNAR